MAATDTRKSKRRRLSPAEEDPQQHFKRKSHQSQDDARDVSANGSSVAIMEHVQIDQMPSVKGLDSSEPAVRRLTMKTMLEHLEMRPESAPFTATQCLQLWRGFFVAIYMHDSRNAVSVQNLLRDIAGTFSTIAAKDDELENDTTKVKDPPDVEHGTTWLEPYHTAFWETISREWATIDSHRMNKYLLLVRFVLRDLFKICLKGSVEPDHKATAKSPKTKSKKSKRPKDDEAPSIRQPSWPTKSCVNILETVGPLNPSQRKISDGLRLHILDIWSDELSGALRDLEESHKSEGNGTSIIRNNANSLVLVVDMLRDPVAKVSLSDSGAQRHVRLRAKDAMKAMDERMEESALKRSDT